MAEEVFEGVTDPLDDQADTVWIVVRMLVLLINRLVSDTILVNC